MRRWYVLHAVSGARCALYAAYTAPQLVVVSNSGSCSCSGTCGSSCICSRVCFVRVVSAHSTQRAATSFRVGIWDFSRAFAGRVWVVAGTTGNDSGGSEGVTIARHTAKCWNFSTHTHILQPWNYCLRLCEVGWRIPFTLPHRLFRCPHFGCLFLFAARLLHFFCCIFGIGQSEWVAMLCASAGAC